MKIGFYLTNSPFKDIDCSNVKDGNPGIGGTHYAMLLLATLMSEMRDSRHSVTIFAESTNHLPLSINAIRVENKDKLAAELKRLAIDILVVNKGGKNTLDKAFFNAIKDVDVKVIIWAHCFMPEKTLREYASNDKVSRIVAVGYEEMLTWADHPIMDKATYVYNICNYPELDFVPFESRKNSVVYIGCITYLKGLHLLTAAWPNIIKAVPDAHLYIIGGGKLYDRNAEVGKYGIAESFYEKKLLKPILTKDGKIHESVTFCGVMGAEKFDILRQAKVGVPNPSGLTETFGYTAIEMQLGGSLVTTKKCPGYLDTVYQQDHILYNSTSELADCVIRLLKRNEYNPSKSIEFIKENFSSDQIVERWLSIFDEVFNNVPVQHYNLHSALESSNIKIKNRNLRKKYPWVPSILVLEDLSSTITYYASKLIHLSDTLQKIYQRKLK